MGLQREREIARSLFWLVPALCVAAAIGLAIGLLVIDHQLGPTRGVFLFPGPPSTARSFLSSIIQAMITFTGLVFTITIVVLQLTSAQFSPRVLRTFLRDRTIHWALGIFLATFVYAMVVLRGVGGSGSGGVHVPRVAVTIALVLVLISVGTFIRYVAHIVNMIRAASIIDSIAVEAREHLEERFPADAPAQRAVTCGAPCQTIHSRSPGVLVAVNQHVIVTAAAAAGAVVVLARKVGDYCPAGSVVMRVHRYSDVDGHRDRGEDEVIEPQRLLEALSFEAERTLGQDLAFAFRELVDIAQKSLSPAVNDPTTAVQAIDVLHDLLRRLAARHLGEMIYTDHDNAVRLVVPQLSFHGYVGLAVGQIWPYAKDAVQVPQRLAEMLTDLEGVALPEHRETIRPWLEKIQPAAEKDPTWDTTLAAHEMHVGSSGQPGR
jgi:uncharacterized membrane protein